MLFCNVLFDFAQFWATGQPINVCCWISHSFLNLWTLMGLLSAVSSTIEIGNRLTLIGMSYESMKNAHLLYHLGSFFYKTQWAWQSVKITWLMSIFTSKFFWKCLIKNQLTHSDPKRKGGGKCPPSCQLRQKQLLPLFSACDASTCTGANKVCDGTGTICQCAAGHTDDPAVQTPGPTTACVPGRKTLKTDETNPQVSKDLEKCQKSHISS